MGAYRIRHQARESRLQSGLNRPRSSSGFMEGAASGEARGALVGGFLVRPLDLPHLTRALADTPFEQWCIQAVNGSQVRGRFAWVFSGLWTCGAGSKRGTLPDAGPYQRRGARVEEGKGDGQEEDIPETFQSLRCLMKES